MPQPLSSRTASFTDSVIRRMTRISMQYDAVNLSQGFPDFDPPKAIMDRLAEVAHEGPHQYAVTWGAQNFREALAKKQSYYMGRAIDPNREIVATCGSTEAMMCAMMTVTNPGDKVVVFSPFYENYGADTILCGAEPIYVPLTPPSFTFDPEVLEDAFRQKPKALVLCNPSNPCGRVFTREELTIIADLAEKYDAYVITDEVYEHIVYAPHQHTYFAVAVACVFYSVCVECVVWDNKAFIFKSADDSVAKSDFFYNAADILGYIPDEVAFFKRLSCDEQKTAYKVSYWFLGGNAEDDGYNTGAGEKSFKQVVKCRDGRYDLCKRCNIYHC